MQPLKVAILSHDWPRWRRPPCLTTELLLAHSGSGNVQCFQEHWWWCPFSHDPWIQPIAFMQLGKVVIIRKLAGCLRRYASPPRVIVRSIFEFDDKNPMLHILPDKQSMHLFIQIFNAQDIWLHSLWNNIYGNVYSIFKCELFQASVTEWMFGDWTMADLISRNMIFRRRQTLNENWLVLVLFMYHRGANCRMKNFNERVKVLTLASIMIIKILPCLTILLVTLLSFDKEKKFTEI